jgi:hypothetical protein
MSQKSDTRYADKLSQLPSYFARRNNINPLPLIKEGINYTNETLFYMCPSARSDKIANSLAVGYGPTRLFLVCEWFAGCGGNTIGFLAHPQIKAVISFEIVPERREMLKNNVSIYGNEFKCKSIIPEEGFNGQDLSMYAGACLMLDPAWLRPETDPSTSTKEDYILSGMTTAGQTLEYWLEYYSNTFYYFELHVPPGYILDESACPSWTCKHKDEENGYGKVTHTRWYGNNKSMASFVKSNKGGLGPFLQDLKEGKCLHGSLGDMSNIQSVNDSNTLVPSPSKFAPSSNTLVPSPNKFAPPSNKLVPSPSKFAPPSNTLVPSPNKFAPSSNTLVPSPSKFAPPSNKLAPSPSKFAPPSNMEESVISLLPEPISGETSFDWEGFCETLPGRKEEIGTDEWFAGLAIPQWLVGLQLYLYALLSPAVKDKDLLAIMIGRTYIGKWVRAFTHITYDLKINYENFEFDGDAELKYIFPLFLRRTFPDATVKEMTEYNHRYMSKEYQYIWARQMKLDQWLLCDQVDPTNTKIAEDLFESFFGVLTEVSNSIIDGLGVIHSFNFLKLIFDGKEFNAEMALGKPISVLQQRGSRLKWRAFRDNDGGIFVKESAKQENKPYTVELTLMPSAIEILRNSGINVPSPLGFGKAASLTGAREIAWKNALDNANRTGYTHEWTIAYKEKQLFNNMGPEYIELINAARNKSMEMGYDSLEFGKVSGGISRQSYKNEDGTTTIINSTTSLLKGINSSTLKETYLAVGRGTDQKSSYIAALENFVR